MAGVMSNNQAIGNPRKSRFDRMMGESLIGRSLQENRRGDVMYFWVHWTWGKENTAVLSHQGRLTWWLVASTQRSNLGTKQGPKGDQLSPEAGDLKRSSSGPRSVAHVV